MLLPTIPFVTSPTIKAETIVGTTVDINVAIHNGSVLMSGATHKPFFPILEGYSWTVGNISYIFHANNRFSQN